MSRLLLRVDCAKVRVTIFSNDCSSLLSSNVLTCSSVMFTSVCVVIADRTQDISLWQTVCMLLFVVVPKRRCAVPEVVWCPPQLALEQKAC